MLRFRKMLPVTLQSCRMVWVMTITAPMLLCLFPCHASATDCNTNDIDDAQDIAGVTSQDCNRNLEPDECELDGGGNRIGLHALCEGCRCALNVNGSVRLHGNTGAIQVNSNHACAFCVSTSSPVVDAPEINVVGSACIDGHPSLPPINSGAPSRPDPLADIPMPTTAGAHDLGTVSGGGNVTIPGGYTLYYAPGGISRTGGNLTLQPNAVYILSGAGLHISGNSNFTALNVLLFITGTGIVDISSTGAITVTPQEYGPWENISIFQARWSTGDCGASRIIGTSQMDLQGTLYFPCASLELGGTGAIGNQWISYTTWVHGTGDIAIQYDGRFPSPCSEDADEDGVVDEVDVCPNTPDNQPVDANGCSCGQLDSDGDGIMDCGDNCPSTPNPGQEDGDANGVGDACEPAPGDIDGNGQINVDDILPFIAVLVGTSQDPAHIRRSDLTGDGTADGADIQAFIEWLLI